jgi:hypothetical protein
VLALLLSLATLPDEADATRLPHPADCVAQARLCRDHLRYLEGVKGARGWEGGRWDAALAETGWRLAWWRLARDAHLAPAGPDARRALGRLRDPSGPAAWPDWHPPRLPVPGPTPCNPVP